MKSSGGKRLPNAFLVAFSGFVPRYMASTARLPVVCQDGSPSLEEATRMRIEAEEIEVFRLPFFFQGILHCLSRAGLIHLLS